MWCELMARIEALEQELARVSKERDRYRRMLIESGIIPVRCER